MFSDELIREINRVSHEVECKDYDERHPEILRDGRNNWSNLAKVIFPMLRGKDGEKGITIVDVGSGTGFVPTMLLEYLSSQDTLICNDISEKMLSVARKKLDDLGCKAKVMYKVGDIESLDLSDYDIDLFTVNSTLHHLPNLDIFFDKVKRHLKEGGILVLAHEPNKRFADNILLSGYRAFSRKVLESLPILENSDDFVFDNQMLLQVFYFGFNVGEISCPALYREESSSIDFPRSLKYGIGVLRTGLKYMIAKSGLVQISIFDKNGKKLQ